MYVAYMARRLGLEHNHSTMGKVGGLGDPGIHVNRSSPHPPTHILVLNKKKFYIKLNT